MCTTIHDKHNVHRDSSFPRKCEDVNQRGNVTAPANEKSSSDHSAVFDLSPERPIVSREADVLGRVPFAEYIAAAIRGWTGNDSLVLALCGEWGTGKSSLKNLIVEALRSNPQKSPYIVEFNPWQWAGQEQ